MAAVWLILRAEFRRRWRAWLALALLVALVGGLVLAAAAAGRRTASAFPRFYQQYGYDSYVYSYTPLPKLAHLPDVASLVPIEGPANGAPTCACSPLLSANNFSLIEVAPADSSRYFKLVSGRLADQSSPDEALISFNFQKDIGLQVGSTIRVPLDSPSQNPSTESTPLGPTVTFHVVGIVADESDFPSVGTQSYELFPTEAFDRSFNSKTGLFYAYAVRLRHGSNDVARFDTEVQTLGALGFGGQETTSSVTSAIHPQAVGWWLLGALVALAGLATLAQALSRQATVEASTYRTLTAMGVEPRQLALIGIIRATAVGIAGAVGAVALAYLLSPFSPVGEARVAEPSSGFYFDPLVLWLGAIGTVLVLLLLGIWPAFRSARQSRSVDVNATSRRPSLIVDRLAAAGTPPPVVTGARRALERGRGQDSVPVGTALGGCALAVAALCATTVFGASLSRLTVTPRLYGQAFQLWFNNLSGPGPSAADPVVSQLRSDPAVTAITLGTSGSVTVNGVSADAIAGRSLRGPELVIAVRGRVPTAPDEVALAAKTMSQAHAHIGSSVRVSAAQPGGSTVNSTFKVVGSTTFPPDFGAVGLNTGAIFSISGYVDAQCPESGPASGTCRQTKANALGYVVLVGLKGGAAGHAAANMFLKEYPQSALLPITPANLVNFGEAVNFPLILGVVLGVFGAATLLHVLVVSVARRRRELGLLKSLGFVRRQAAATACWQAITVALVGLVVGVPLGVATGEVVWRAFAGNLGVVPDPAVPVMALLTLAGAVLLGAIVLSVGPALVSARAAVAPLLRSE